MEFKSSNALKGTVLALFFTLFGVTVLAFLISVLRRPDIFHDITQGQDRAKWLVYLLPFILPIIWLFLPPTRVILDRDQRVVHHRQGKRQFDFPWEQISFKHQWLPTKTGGSTLFTLIALPPYPGELNRLIEKKARPAPGQVYTFNLGSFDVKGPEHGQAIHAFLDAWMRSREPAATLYEELVGSRFRD